MNRRSARSGGNPLETPTDGRPRLPSERLRFINDSCPNIVSNGRLKLIHAFEGGVWLGPHSVASLRSVPCGTIIPKPCAGCGVLASAAKVLIAPICTTCADRARSGTPNTAAWPPRRTRPAALQCGSIAPTPPPLTLAPGLAQTPNPERAVVFPRCDDRRPVALSHGAPVPTRLS